MQKASSSETNYKAVDGAHGLAERCQYGENKKAVGVACTHGLVVTLSQPFVRRTATRQHPTPAVTAGPERINDELFSAHIRPPYKMRWIIPESAKLSSVVEAL